jgi:radical SAM protein with 4Fe4S-binding SPASM domain
MSFWAYLNEEGDVFPCIRFLGLKEFVFGNIYKQNFKEIWNGGKRKVIMERIYSEWKIDDCRKACRMDQINEYLWALKNPPEHVNFI